MAMRRSSFSSAIKFWCLIVLHSFVAAFLARGQSISENLGFLYIDCGLPANTSYTDLLAGITYISDDQFIDTGKSYNVSSRYANNHARQYYTVRSFPDGDRNCYILNTIKSGMKYLIRAAFLYGNYDLKNTTPQFDLYLDVNLWKTMNVTDPSRKYLVEAIIEPTAHRVSVCLVNTGQGTPFISGLDLRPIESSLYPMVKASGSLVLLTRLNLGGTYEIRFPFDAYDRYWLLDEDTPSWMKLSTNSSIQYLADDPFQVPSVVMQSAVYPANSTKLELILKPDSGDLNEYFAVMHFSELQSPSQNDSRQFFVSLNGALLNEAQSLTPEFLISQSVYSKNPCTGTSDYYNISLSQTSNSTLPPMLNAIEVFSAMTNINIASHIRDVDAMMAIKEWYQVKKNWNGDPCAPKLYVWDGLNCTFNASASPRVITVNLSNSELTGEINTYFANLGAVQYLDLSHNNLTGPIPAGLAYLPSLKLLDLRNNQLNGSVPSSLLTRSQNGSLTLRIEGNPNICFNITSCEAKLMARRKKNVPKLAIIFSCIVLPIIVSIVVIIICRLRKQQELVETKEHQPLESRKFTYKELEKITRNFVRIIGKGGFGTVYQGYLENGTQVAVKVLSETSTQATKQFLIEVQILTRIHHKNLVSLVGYCEDKKFHALVYEYMSQGSIHDHLIGKPGSILLSWENRLHIAFEAAKGLEYLHYGCRPTIVHRDITTKNILLNEKFEVKIADFGLSRALDVQAHVSTRVVGTPGYLDPEYHRSYRLTKKSDVYSFGVVLLELITGLRPILPVPERYHITEWVNTRLSRGNMDEVVDARLQGIYDANSAWKWIKLAMNCTAQASAERPTIVDVVAELNDISQVEITQKQNQNSEDDDMNQNINYPIEVVQSTNTWVMSDPSSR